LERTIRKEGRRSDGRYRSDSEEDGAKEVEIDSLLLIYSSLYVKNNNNKYYYVVIVMGILELMYLAKI
jgi:hypothetical protein